MPHLEPRRLPRSRLTWTIACSVLLTAGCGGGGGGGGGGGDSGTSAPPPPAAGSDTQTLPTARAVLDALRASHFLAADVQNIVVSAPTLVARGDLDENCDQGGTLQTRVLRNAGAAQGPLVRQQFNDCRTAGVLLQGVQEINYTRSTSESNAQPWAGSVRFTDYRISSGARSRAYQGLAVAEGSLNGPAGAVQPLLMQLSDFRLQDSPDTLQREVISTTASFRLQRASALGAPYSLEGDWQQQAAGLRVELNFAPGSQLPLLDDIAAAPATGSIRWTDTAEPSFSGNFILSPAGGSRLRVQLDLGADGSVDRDVVLDRYTQIGFSL